MTAESHDDVSMTPDPRGRKVAEFKVYWNKPSGKRVLILQFPNRDRNKPFNASNGQKPLELRLKPTSGLIEVDIPINVHKNYDKYKGIQYAQALRQSKTLQAGGEFGLAGGFGANAQHRASRDGSRTIVEEPTEHLAERFQNTVKLGLTMDKITLGGRIRTFQTGDPIYAIGVFRGEELHLTKVDAICSLQPQFHHLDAISDSERATNRSQATSDHPAPGTEARAVNMAVKSTDDEEMDMTEVGKTLRIMQEEPWQHLEWIDEEDARSYFTYANELMLSNTSDASRLVSAMSEKQYLDAISAPRLDPTKQGRKVMISRPWSSSSEDDEVEGTDLEDVLGEIVD